MVSERTYDLHLLGWHSFQQLCHTVTREILGQTIQSFLDTGDGGRDGAFAGNWVRAGYENLTGKFVIQCKFFSKRDSIIKVSDVSDELKKVARLVKEERCDSYIIMTNGILTGPNAEKIESKILELGVKQVVVFGATWICQQIHENKKLRTSVPRLYGLGDLSEILDGRAYSQAKALLHSMREDLAKVVITDAYRKASDALNDHGFVILIGEPAAGKTTIASMLAMAALDQWGAYTIKADTVSKLVDHWNSDNPSQLFWIDDAFGITQYDSTQATAWNRILPHVKGMLDQGVKIVMTSRDYIYASARQDLKEGAFPLLKESNIVIDVKDLTEGEKEQILYNHLRLGKQSKDFLGEIKQFLSLVAAHVRFIPETARRLGDPVFTRDLYLANHTISKFVAEQRQFLKDVLLSLDKHSKAALALIYMRNDSLDSPIELLPEEEKALSRLGSDVGDSLQALQAMNGSLVNYINSESEATWRYKHPTIGDAYAEILAEKPELLSIYITGAEPEKLVGQITCGDVGLEKATIIPTKLFEEIISKLDSFKNSGVYKAGYLSDWSVKRQLLSFLTRRSSKNFLQLFLERKPDFLENNVLALSGYLRWSEELDFVLRLNELDLLDESARIKVIDSLFNFAKEGDLYTLEDEDVQKLFRGDELNEFKLRVKTEIVPKLSEIRYDFESNYDRSGINDADEHMDYFLGALRTIKGSFEDELINEILDQEEANAKEWISENKETRYEKPDRKLDSASSQESFTVSRNIFDDIAE